ncbi:MAG: hypothetical protein PVJ78_00560 [Gammaproteobacteria bacterium]|jgi:hypothetical protein
MKVRIWGAGAEANRFVETDRDEASLQPRSISASRSCEMSINRWKHMQNAIAPWAEAKFGSGSPAFC